MKQARLLTLTLLATFAGMLTSCEKTVINEDTETTTPDKANSLLQVITRSEGDATVSNPVQVYVFQEDECRAVQTIGDAGQTLNIALTEGTYNVYAIGGASSTDYTLPTKDEATMSTAITLKDGRALTDLMTATATATLVDGGTNTVTLGMTRKTMLIQDITIKKIPTAATAVSVTIAPLWQALTVCGGFATASASSTIALTKQSDNRTWKNTASAYLLPPSSQPASISVNITTATGTKTYTYSCSDQLAAGYKINIDGTYTEAVGVSLTGTITGATWLGERTISFTFDENGASSSSNSSDTSGSSDTSNPDGLPAVGSTYQGCYVLASDVEDDGESAEVTLMSPNETTCLGTEAAVTAAIENCGVAAISGWDLPTKTQMQLIEAKLIADDATLAGEKYLWRKTNGNLGYRMLGTDETAWPNALSTTTYRLRPVAVVTVTAE